MRYSANNDTRRRTWTIAWLALLLTTAMTPNDVAATQLPLEYTSYAIDVVIAIDDPAELNDAARVALHARLGELADAHIGPAWTMRSRTAGGLVAGELLARFDQISPHRLVELTPAEQHPHKAMCVVLRHGRGGWNVAVRELDFRTYQLSPVVQRERIAHSRLAEELFEAIVAAFSPVAELQAARGDVVEGKLQAAHLITADDSPLWLAAGDPLLPIVRRNDRLGRAGPEDVLALPWTVLEARGINGANVTCQIHSAHVNPLGGKSRLRLKRYAQAARYAPTAARLSLQTPGESPTPLVGYDIVRRDEATGEVQVVGRTGDDGSAMLPAPGDTWQLLYVRHGDRILARLPMITGWRARYTVALPSDDVRLAAEGFVSAFRQEIIDTVAQRQILTARIRRRIAAGQFDEAEALLESFRQLEKANEFASRLNVARAELVADNTRAQQLIDQMFDETRQTLQRYLVAGEGDALAKQLAAARAEG